MEQRYPIGIYLDTNAIVKGIETTPLNSTYRRAYQILQQKASERKCICMTTHFALMEAADQLKEHESFAQAMKTGKLSSTINRYIHRDGVQLEDVQIDSAMSRISQWCKENSDFVRIEPFEFTSLLTQDVLEFPYAISEKSCIGAPDCIHLASALLLNCDVILTHDTHLRDEVRSRLSQPGSALYERTLQLLSVIAGIAQDEFARSIGGSELIKAWKFEELIAYEDQDEMWTRVQPQLPLRLAQSKQQTL